MQTPWFSKLHLLHLNNWKTVHICQKKLSGRQESKRREKELTPSCLAVLFDYITPGLELHLGSSSWSHFPPSCILPEPASSYSQHQHQLMVPPPQRSQLFASLIKPPPQKTGFQLSEISSELAGPKTPLFPFNLS